MNGRCWTFCWLIPCLLFALPWIAVAQSPASKGSSVDALVVLNIPSPQKIGEQASTRSLLDVLSESQRNNLNVARVKSLAQAAKAAYHAQLQRWWPQLTVQVGMQLFGGLNQGNFGDVRFVAPPALRFDPMLQLAYVLNPANVTLQSRRRYQEYRAAQHQQTHVKDAVLLATALAYQQIIHAQVSLSLLDRGIEELQKLHALAKARFSTGVGSEAELLQIQSRLAQAEMLRPALIARLRSSATQLNLALGRSAIDLIYADSQPLQTLLLTAWNTKPQILLSQALRNHPQILQAQAQFHALHHQKQALSLGTWLPSVHLLFQGGVLSAGVLNNPLETAPQYSMRLMLQWSFDVSSLGQHRELHHRQSAIHRGLQHLRLYTTQQITLAYTQARLAYSQLATARRFVQTAEQSLRLQEARYQSGTGHVLDVIESQRTLVQARQQLLDTIMVHNRAQIMLQGLRGNLQPRDFIQIQQP